MSFRFKSALEKCRYVLQPPDWTNQISPLLPFGETANALFLADLEVCTNYLEFGAGSSTLNAVWIAPDVVSVESDRRFLAEVQRQIIGSTARTHLLHGDVGLTGPWGVPAITAPVMPQMRRWSRYPVAPWAKIGADYRADLVLVDGRFRVACALTVVLNQYDSDWKMLVDDYSDRPEYSIVERFAHLEGMRGRMAVFRPKDDLDLEEVSYVRNDCYRDWR